MAAAAEQLTLDLPTGSKSRVWAYFRSETEVKAEPALLGYAHHILRAFDKEVLGITGVLCVDGVPTIYYRRSEEEISWEEANRLQRVFWNQGIANILILAAPDLLRIYSGQAKPVRDGDASPKPPALVEQEARDVADLLELETLLHQVNTGHFYHLHPGHFDEKQAVDHFLLQNLADARDELVSAGFKEEASHSLLGRLIFLCYLTDRGVIDWADYQREVGAGISNIRQLLQKCDAADGSKRLQRLFAKLHRTFNGSMFDGDDRRITRKQYDILRAFFAVADVKKNQGTLGFWGYDFRVIPVETISSIYEDFLSKEDAEGKRKKGAFYTPRHLAEMVVDVAITDDPDWHKRRYLDCSSGSGIFLVTLFNRLASHWVFANERAHYKTRAKALLHILQWQLCGVDVERTACRIASFSLYLAFLDQFAPRDLREFARRAKRERFKVLPKLLHYQLNPRSQWKEAHPPTIYHQDFHRFQPGELFDCVIGNPPWAGRGTGQHAWEFMQEAPRHLVTKGTGCLLLPAKVILNKTDDLQKNWFQTVNVQRVVNLSDFRHILFEHAKCPAVIIRFFNEKPDAPSHIFRYDTPKVTGNDTREGVITIYPRERQRLKLAALLAAIDRNESPKFWKSRLTASPRDLRLLDLLESCPKLESITKHPSEDKDGTARWYKGQGIKPNGPDKTHVPWWKETRMFLSARSKVIHLGVFEKDCEKVGKRFHPKVHRKGEPALFEPPLVIASQGFGKVAFCNFPILFQHAIQSITVASLDPEKRVADGNLLLFLTVYLRSRLARYYLFHTAANWGTERDKVHLFELLHLPFPLPGDEQAHTDAAEIVERVATKTNALRQSLESELNQLHAEEEAQKGKLLRSDKFEELLEAYTRRRLAAVDALQAELESEVYRYFDLTEEEIALVEDTILITEPSSTPTNREEILQETIPSLGHVGPDELIRFAGMLTGTLNSWTGGGKKRVEATAVCFETKSLVLLTLRQTLHPKPFRLSSITPALERELSRIYAAAIEEHGRFDQPRTILWFDKDKASIHLLKPAALMHWTRAAALNDADEIFARVMQQRRARNA